VAVTKNRDEVTRVPRGTMITRTQHKSYVPVNQSSNGLVGWSTEFCGCLVAKTRRKVAAMVFHGHKRAEQLLMLLCAALSSCATPAIAGANATSRRCAALAFEGADEVHVDQASGSGILCTQALRTAAQRCYAPHAHHELPTPRQPTPCIWGAPHGAPAASWLSACHP
jgi:hypothetical protein